MIRAFANRLVHLGRKAHVVGEIACPHTQLGALLLIVSGSGETGSLVDIAQRAGKSEVRIALIIASPSSTLARLADAMLAIPAQSKGGAQKSIQPLASSFEQVCMFADYAACLLLMKRYGESGETFVPVVGCAPVAPFCVKGWPHFWQHFASSAFLVPHFGQNMAGPP